MRTVRSLGILFEISHDLHTYYSIWFLMVRQEYADIAFRYSLYLPHTWLFLTPVFAGGWGLGRLLMLGINAGAIVYIWRRLAGLMKLTGLRKWALLSFFMAWISPGIVWGLGNVALICLAAALAGFPFNSPKKGIFLAFAAMKQSLVFPIFFGLLWKRPGRLMVPVGFIGATTLMTFAWTGISPFEGLDILRNWSKAAADFNDHTSTVPLFKLFLGSGRAASIASWFFWLGLCMVMLRFVRDEFIMFSALLLTSLLPLYHNFYDLIVAAPALAILLKRCHWVWPAALTFALSGVPYSFMTFLKKHGIASESGNMMGRGYHFCLIIALLISLIWIDRSTESRTSEAQVSEPAKGEPMELANIS